MSNESCISFLQVFDSLLTTHNSLLTTYDYENNLYWTQLQ